MKSLSKPLNCFAVEHGLLQHLRQIARTTMFMAISAFVLQGALISVSQAKAALGAMPEPSVTLSGSVHFHDQLAGHAHSHGGNNAEGHVHDGRIMSQISTISDRQLPVYEVGSNEVIVHYVRHGARLRPWEGE